MQVATRQLGVSVPGGDGLALLGHPKAPAQRARRLGADGPARRSSAPRHRPAAAVEDREHYLIGLAYARDRLLRSVERPVRGQVAAVLVAVRVADHDHLLAAARRQMRAIDGKREELLEDAGGGVEIVEGFEEGHDLECRLDARPSREEEQGQEIGRAARYRGDV